MNDRELLEMAALAAGYKDLNWRMVIIAITLLGILMAAIIICVIDRPEDW